MVGTVIMPSQVAISEEKGDMKSYSIELTQNFGEV
jgi:hypothetical protein